jgi:hypothetical protein
MKTFLKNVAGLLQKNSKRLVLLLVLALAVLLVMDYNARMTGLNQITQQLHTVQTQEGEVALTNQFLKTQIAYATSEPGVVEWAYDEGMDRPGDVPIVPLSQPGVTPTPTPLPVSTSVPPQNWQVWLLLFFSD